jgi:hypothetical protein
MLEENINPKCYLGVPIFGKLCKYCNSKCDISLGKSKDYRNSRNTLALLQPTERTLKIPIREKRDFTIAIKSSTKRKAVTLKATTLKSAFFYF